MKQLDEIQARAVAATKGPWESYRDGLTMYVRDKEGYLDPIQTGYVGNRGTVTDAEFIAHAREDVPALVAALRAVEAVHVPQSCEAGCCDQKLCVECYEAWPCPTILLIREAMGG